MKKSIPNNNLQFNEVNHIQDISFCGQQLHKLLNKKINFGSLCGRLTKKS